MQAAEILDRFEDYLRQYVADTRGHSRQEPYRGDLFKLFAQAYKQGYTQEDALDRLTGSSIREDLLARYRPGNTLHEPRQLTFLDQVCPMWDDWRYALDHYR